jgi:hypothetical protein
MAAGRTPGRPAAAPPAVDPAERRKQQRARNWALLIALATFAALVYAVSIVRMSGG